MKTFNFFTILLLAACSAKAQVNLALTATASQSAGGGTGTFGPGNYNDNNIPNCKSTTTCKSCTDGSYGYANAGTTAWIEFTWPANQYIDKVVFYKGQQGLTQATLQYWDGGKYVDIVKYNSTACHKDSLSFTGVVSTRFRLYGLASDTKGAGPSFREIQVSGIPPCSGASAAGFITGSSPSGTPLCKGSMLRLSVSGAMTGQFPGDILYQWQRRDIKSPVSSWADIDKATDTLYESDTLTDWEYRFAVICTAKKDTAHTAPYGFPELPTPEVNVTPSGPLTICAGDSAWLVTDNIAGAVYTWMKDSIPVYGWKFNNFAATETGNYMVKVETPDPCPGYSKPVTLAVTDPGFKADIVATADSILCEGEIMTLSGTTTKTWVSYQWRHNNTPIPGATGASYAAGKAGYYRVAISDGSACPALSRNIPLTVYPRPDASVLVPEGKLSACAGKGVLLVSNPTYAYQWSFNGKVVVGWNDDSLRVNNTGNYTLETRSSYGCSNTSAPVSITILPAPVPVISKSGTVLSTSAGYAFYTWVRNGTETIASGPGLNTVTLAKTGLYTVTVTDDNDCSGTSDPIEAWDKTLGIGTATSAGEAVTIYPNPVQDKVFIESPVPVEVRIESVTGQLLYQGRQVNEVSIGTYPNGLYLFTIYDQQGNMLRKEKINKITP